LFGNSSSCPLPLPPPAPATTTTTNYDEKLIFLTDVKPLLMNKSATVVFEVQPPHSDIYSTLYYFYVCSDSSRGKFEKQKQVGGFSNVE